jgi:hypothetical protein
LTASVDPLVDDHPYRVDQRQPLLSPSLRYAQLMDADGARERFRTSAFVRRLWPAVWAERTLPAFGIQALLNRHAWSCEGLVPPDLAMEEQAIASGHETLATWSLGSSAEEQAIASRLAAAGSTSAELLEIQGLRALARHEFREAESLLARAEPHAVHAPRLRWWRILALGLAGDREGVARLWAEAAPLMASARTEEDKQAWRWIARRFGLAQGS